ncbi:putative LRR containing protein [Trachipleistophora hominis]|uniref:Putative LRR containing protein n=1 Tax=Trachipleistophora hominis TaxID=72359 RepID=L7JX36_TRAHO|nr:putative LRR containing protein [Trachipleistophora hominis]
MGLKYIFVFTNEQGTNEVDFLLFENPGDAEMSYLLNSHEMVNSKLSLSHETVKYVYYEKTEMNYRTIYDNVHYHSHIAGIRRIIYRIYHDVIRENADVRFEVVHVPFTMLLYQKVMKCLQQDVIPDINTKEACTLLTHFALFDEYVKESIAYVICVYLLANTELFHDIRDYRENPDDNQYALSTRRLYQLIFSDSKASIQFRKAVKSYARFSLFDKDGNSAQIYNASDNRRFHRYNIDICNFSLDFLLDRLDIDFRWLEKNMKILDEKFNVGTRDSPYSVYI